jgi:hypothetical protein
LRKILPMSEYNERRWAVISSRGREASGLPYAEAAELVRGLKAAGGNGLCIVTDEAAGRLAPAPTRDTKTPATPAEQKRPRRAPTPKSSKPI